MSITPAGQLSRMTRSEQRLAAPLIQPISLIASYFIELDQQANSHAP
jgi:hypothetical protein